MEGSVIVLDEDGFLPAAFRKVQKIGKRLRTEVMEPATKQDFCKETDSRGLGKTERIAFV